MSGIDGVVQYNKSWSRNSTRHSFGYGRQRVRARRVEQASGPIPRRIAHGVVNTSSEGCPGYVKGRLGC